jgi:hypothetical protein
MREGGVQKVRVCCGRAGVPRGIGQVKAAHEHVYNETRDGGVNAQLGFIRPLHSWRVEVLGEIAEDNQTGVG